MLLEISFELSRFDESLEGEKREIDDIVLRHCSNSIWSFGPNTRGLAEALVLLGIEVSVVINSTV